jgi:hypothetical protein
MEEAECYTAINVKGPLMRGRKETSAPKYYARIVILTGFGLKFAKLITRMILRNS